MRTLQPTLPVNMLKIVMLPVGRRLLTVMLAVAVLGLSATAARAMEVAVQDDEVFLYHHYYNSAQAYGQARAIGARFVRFNFLWGDFKRHGYGLWDRAVDEARGQGFKVQFTVAGTPQYDPSGNQALSYRRADPKRYAKWATEIAKHFKGRVLRYSIWNEPNLSRWIRGSKSTAAKTYRKLVLAAYPAFKKVDGRNQVLIGELTSAHDPLGFLNRMSSGLKADGFAYHPFQFYTEPGKRDRKFVGISNTPAIKSTLRSLARKHRLTTLSGGTLPLYYTEFGYLTKGVYHQSESSRTQWTLEAFQLARRYGARQMLYYQLVHSPQGRLNGDIWDSGIVNLNGSTTGPFDRLRANVRKYR